MVTFQAFFPEQIAFLKMEVEQRLRGRIVRKPKEQVWMLKTDSVRNTNTQIHKYTKQNTNTQIHQRASLDAQN